MKRVRLEVAPQKRAARKWKLTRNSAKHAEFESQAAAIALARLLAKQIEAEGGTVTLKIKRRDGTIRDERTYPLSSDPRDIPG